MAQLSDVQAFIDVSRRVGSAAELHGLMETVSLDMGFDHFALIHHVDLRTFGTIDGHTLTGEFVALSNYPQSWMDSYVADEIVNFDPVLAASQRTNVGFGWSQIDEIISVSRAQREVIERTQRAGICDGFTVPANIPGELSGSCNFATGPERLAPKHNFAMAQLVGSFAFQAARNLVIRTRDLDRGPPVTLTQRQLECIVLVARGKTDWEISRILGITEETVRQHIKTARERYDVPKRVQVVLRAIYDGLVPLSEMVS